MMTSVVQVTDGDFLHKAAQTPLRECYSAAGALCDFSTNCEALLTTARECFLRPEEPSRAADFSVRFWIDTSDKALPPWPKPYVRGLDDLVFASFDSGSSMLADLAKRRVIGRFSSDIAHDAAYWRTVIFPILLTIMGASVGIAELHCACVANGINGLLLAGPSGSGKSTLALVLSQMGHGFLSDDRTFCSLAHGEVLAWGLLTRFKVRSEAIGLFPSLGHIGLNNKRGEDLWIEPEAIGIRRVRHCRPHSLIFLEQQRTPCFRLLQLSATKSEQRLHEDLMAEEPERAMRRSETIKRVAQVPSWLLKYGGNPRMVAREICSALAWT